jgi:ribosomal protein S18 acetylase RimI-like enzyme
VYLQEVASGSSVVVLRLDMDVAGRRNVADHGFRKRVYASSAVMACFASVRIAATIMSDSLAPSGDVLGSVDLITDMHHYGSGGTASSITAGAGMRLLAVKSESRGLGVGSALTRHCLERAVELGRSRLILHTIKAMQTAWSMYERCGFRRFPRIDFHPGALEVLTELENWMFFRHSNVGGPKCRAIRTSA